MIGFVPVTPSARARRLASRLTETIDAFQRENPHTTSLEIQQALQAARPAGAAGRLAIIVGILLAIALGLGLIFLQQYR